MIQIDIKMSKCCDECFALDDHGDYPFCLISQDQRGYTFNTKEKQMPTCPLKAQEPVKPEMIMYTGAGIGISNCPRCGYKIDEYHNDKFCGSCGQAVKWDD